MSTRRSPDFDLQSLAYAMDIGAKDVVGTGRHPAPKSKKTLQLKSQMEKKPVKSQNRRKKSVDNNSQNKITLKPFAAPITIVTELDSNIHPALKSKVQSSVSKIKSKTTGTPKGKKVSSMKIDEAAKPSMRISQSRVSQLSTDHHKQELKDPSITIPNIDVDSQMMTSKSINAFCTRVDMKGFTNDEISLDVQEHQLTITGYRPRRGINNSRKVTEYVEVPGHVLLENLRIGRRSDGAVIIEENEE